MIVPAGGSMCTDPTKLTAADNWLKNNIDPLIKSPALANSVFIIVFDESLDMDVANGGGQSGPGDGGIARESGLQVDNFVISTRAPCGW